MFRTKNPLELPFLDYLAIVEVFDGVISKKIAYRIIHELLNERDENGNLLIDPARMPPTKRLIVPTDVLCKKYQIKQRTKRKDVRKATN